MGRALSLSRRLAGLALLGFSVVPLHRLLDPASTGLAGDVTRGVAEAAWMAGLWGGLLTVVVAIVLARLFGPDPLFVPRRMARVLTRVPSPLFALLCAVVALMASGVVAWRILALSPSSVDEMVELLHARSLASGHLTLRLPGEPAAWIIQNSLLTQGGTWASV